MGHVDHTQATGNGGVMLIREADAAGTPNVIGGNQVQFHIRAGLSGTFVGSPGFLWDGYINNGWGNLQGGFWRGRVANISGTTWRHVATFDIGYTQDVCFKIDFTGTQGFGGPTEFWRRINRAVAPSPVAGLVASELTSSSVRISWNPPASDGGQAISAYLLRYSSVTPADTGNFVNHSQENNRTRLVTGLTPGQRLYFTVYAHNGVGYSQKSSDLLVVMPGRAYVGKGGGFVPAAEIRAGATAALAGDVRVGKGGSYVPTG